MGIKEMVRAGKLDKDQALKNVEAYSNEAHNTGKSFKSLKDWIKNYKKREESKKEEK